VWREVAENVAASLSKGMRVVATGKLKQRSYETQQGEKRTSIELEVDEIGPSLRYAKAQVTRNQGQGRSDAIEDAWGGQSNQPVAPQNSGWASDSNNSGWSTPGNDFSSDDAPF